MVSDARYALAWLFPLIVLAALWRSPAAALTALLCVQFGLVIVELQPWGPVSFAPTRPSIFHRIVLWVHVPLQFALLATGAWMAGSGAWGVGGAVAAGIAVGGICGSQGITFAHELGHSRSRLDRGFAWILMSTVLYAHFMVEHYRGHHVHAATATDPASARRGESLWRFLPRTLAGSWRSAWSLERARIRTHRVGRWRSPLLAAMLAQGALMLVLFAALGPLAAVFWLVQAAYAVFLLESINYVEHYGLQRRPGERFGAQHAWSADHALTNSIVANLERHADHHMKAWKPYPALEALDGPRLPGGYASCVYLAAMPPLWFRVMHPRLPSGARTAPVDASELRPLPE